MDNDERKKKRNLDERDNRGDEPSKEGERSPWRRQRTSVELSSLPSHQPRSLTAFLADEHQRSRQAAYESEFQQDPRSFEQHQTATSGSHHQSSAAPARRAVANQSLYPAGRDEFRDTAARTFPSSHRRSESADDSFAEAIADIGTDDNAPRFDPGDLAWAEAERKLEYDVSSIQPLPILPPFHERRLLPLDQLLDPSTSFSGAVASNLTDPRRERSDPRGDNLDQRRQRSGRADPPREPNMLSREAQQHSRPLPADSEFSPSRGIVDPRRTDYRPIPISSFNPNLPQHYDADATRPPTLTSSSFPQIPGLNTMFSPQQFMRRHESIQPVAPSQAATQNSDGGYVIPVLAPNDRQAMTPYQVMLRQSLEYFTAVEDDVRTTVQGRRKPVMPGQLGIRCRYCSHLPVAGRMRAAVYYPRSLMNLYQGAQNIASVHFQQCTEFPPEVLQRLMEEKPRRDFSRVGKPYWSETCRQLGIYEEQDALWFSPRSEPSLTSNSEQTKPSGHAGK